MRSLMQRRIGPRSDPLKELVQAHFLEYQAMVTRISRFMSLQFIVWPVLVAFVTLAATGSQYKILTPFLFVWISAFATQLIVGAYYFALYEVYNHVRYIEKVLRPKVATLLGTDSFWGYEKYLNKTGKSYSPWIGDAVFPIGISLAAIAVPTWWTWKNCWSAWDFLLLALDILCLVGISSVARRVVKVRLDFTGAA